MNWIKKHSVGIYFMMVLTITYGSLFLFAGLDGLADSKKEMDQLFPILILFLLLGPIFSGSLLTALISGKTGLKDYFKPFLKWRLDFKWYLSLLLIPLMVLLILLPLSLINKEYLPALMTDKNPIQILLIGLSIGFFGGGLFEEFGWTGFLMGKMDLKHLVKTGLTIGIVWGIWHLPVTYFASVDSNGVFSMAMFLPTVVFYLLILPVYRVIMVHVYYINKSFVFSMLMHTVLTASTVFILLPKVIGQSLILYYVILFVCFLTLLLFIRHMMRKKAIL